MRFRRRFAPLRLTAGIAIPVITVPSVSEATPKPVLDLENLSGQQAEAMMAAGQLTSVELTRADLQRIDVLNQRGPGLNAVTQLNPDALRHAAQDAGNGRRGTCAARRAAADPVAGPHRRRGDGHLRRQRLTAGLLTRARADVCRTPGG